MNEQFNNNSTQTDGKNATLSFGAPKNIEEQTSVCPSCKSILTSEQNFCPNCGSAVEKISVPKNLTCTICGTELSPEAKFCPGCGSIIEKVSAPKTLTCTNCGTEISPETTFCQKCGKPVLPPLNIFPKEKPKQKKKAVLIGGIVAAVALIAVAISLFFALREVPVDYIELSETKIELKVDETKNVSCTVYPENASDKTVTWSSSDKTVATVSAYGRITAVGKGSCTITARSGNQSKTISVTVKPKIDLQKLYYDYCNYNWAKLGSDKSYLSVDSNPYDYEDGDSRYIFVVDDAIQKINKALGLPDSLYEDMNQTSWSMGKQTERFESVGVIVTWTYHPNYGLEVTYKLINN